MALIELSVVWELYHKLIHLARAIPPSLVTEALQLFDVEVRQCFAQIVIVHGSRPTESKS